MAFLFAAALGAPSLASARSGLFGSQTQAKPCPSCPRRQPVPQISMRYREPTPCKQQSDKYRRSGEDVGSTEVQISQLSYRVKQLTAHLQANKKDYATQRGLSMILGKRRRLLKYMQATDRPKYENLIKTLGIRPIKVQAAKGISIRVTARGIQVEAEGDNLPE
ncbi:hypothetical protein WJX84_008945 [Apatococcus fuscideae]|uniref:30S ribosomal protein S15 n=1 Tax=Apatococcus fuscideae TaxID=2026836 RepID=A0AAW1RQD6_9CHLO